MAKKQSLKQQFNYYKYQLQRQYISEQASTEALGLGSIERMPPNLFRHLDFEEVKKQGITRKKGGKTVRYYGAVALRIQIKAMKRRASPNYLRELFLQNYAESMRKVGYSVSQTRQVMSELEKLSNDEISILIKRGIIPEIAFVYASEPEEFENLFGQLQRGIKYAFGLRKTDFMKAYKTRKKEIAKEIKRREQVFRNNNLYKK